MSRYARMDAACLRRSTQSSVSQLADRFCDLVLLMGALALILLAGCVTPAKQAAARQAPSGPQPEPSAAEAAPTKAEAADDRLAAVEDFLNRTQQYRSESARQGRLEITASPATTTDGRLSGAGALEAGPPVASRSAPTDLPPAGHRVSANVQMDAIAAPAVPQPALPALEHIGIRTNPVIDSTENAARNGANVAMRAADDVQAGFDRFIAHLQREAEETGTFESQWRLRLTLLAMDRRDQARDLPQTLAAEEKELLSELVESAIVIRELVRNSAANAEDAVERLEALLRALATRSDPVVSGLAFCSKVTTFGVYDEMKEADFVAGRSIATILYSELRNFRSQLNAAGLYETKLKTRVEVFSSAGESIWSREEPEILDTCRNRRRDFFIAQRLNLPPTLPAGDYVLKAFVEDVNAGRATEATKRFSIAAPISVAKTDSR